MGSLDYDGIRVDIPNSLTCLSRNLNPCNYDLSGLGPGLGVVDETRTNMNQDLGESEEATNREIIIVLCNDNRDRYYCQVSSPARLWMVALKEPQYPPPPPLLCAVHHL